jgi:hypothetical protein
MGIIRFLKLSTLWIAALVFLCARGMITAQNSGAGDNNASLSRGSIPEVLLRPQRGEAPRYPVDTVIGALGRGSAPGEAYVFARQAAAALLAGNINAPSLAAMNRAALESHVSTLGAISPRTYRIGSGREEADGAVSFLVRFVGREQGITGELYIRLQGQPAAAPREAPVREGASSPEVTAPSPPPAPSARRVWLIEDLILDEPRSRESENDESTHRFDFPPYERFF